MRRVSLFFLLLAAALAVVALPGRAQTYTQVSGTIIDPNGLPYSNATITISVIGVSGGQSPSVTPCAQGGCPVMDQMVTTSNTGSFTITLPANGSITPSGTQWNFAVYMPGVAPPIGYGPQSFSYPVPISGSTQSLSTALSALAPALARSSGSTPGRMRGSARPRLHRSRMRRWRWPANRRRRVRPVWDRLLSDSGKLPGQ
jgi:hypothetical protein